MKIKSGIATQWSGSMGGLTGSHNQGGMYLRARSVPINPSTIFQQAVRNAMLTLAGRFQTVLNAVQRDAWKTYSTNVPITDRLGEPRPIGAMGQYQRSNVIRIQAGLTVVDDAPTVFSLPTFTPPTITAIPVTPTDIAVTFDAADAWAVETGGAMVIYASRPAAASINFFKGPYRLASAILGDLTTPPTSPTSVVAQFGAAVGNKVFVQIRVVRMDGRVSSAYRLSTIAQ